VPQSRSGRGGEQKNSQPFSGIEPLAYFIIEEEYITGRRYGYLLLTESLRESEVTTNYSV